MKCTNNTFIKKIVVLLILNSMIFSMAGCTKSSLPLDFKVTNDLSTANIDNKVDGFSTNLAVSEANVVGKAGFNAEDESAAGLFDVNDAKVLYAKDIYSQMNPASLTKIMTAICALKYGNLSDTIICGENVNKLEPGASTCGLKPGDHLSLEQALYFLLLPSANDAAIAIAEHISGSVEQFSVLMNTEANRLGATTTNFVNPHGLTQENHYTTVYDMYLITNEAIHYSKFLEIIQESTYTTTITDGSGVTKTIDVKTSNKFHDGTYTSPERITVIGGKTGTTTAAGSCLALVTRDSKNNPYISVILHASDRGKLYEEMIELLEEINSK